MSKVIYINGVEDFEREVKNFKGVALVDFWAEWCQPCRMLGPIVEELSEDYADDVNVKFVKINVDENQELAAQFEVMSIPAVFMIKNGESVENIVGVREKDIYADKIDGLLD